MKKNVRNMLIGVAAVAIGVSVTVYSCEKEQITPSSGVTGETLELKSVMPRASKICSEIVTKRMYRQGTKEFVGTAYLYNDPEHFYVLLFAEKGHYFKDAYMTSGASYKDFPFNSDGNLAFTDFKYSITSEPLSNVRRFIIPIGDIKDKKFMSVMAQVRHSNYADFKQRAWVAGRYLGSDQAGQGFVHEVELCKTEPTGLPAQEVAQPAPTSLPADKE